MGLCRSMSVLKSFLGAVGGPLILTALSSSDAVKAVPNTLKLSQDKVNINYTLLSDAIMSPDFSLAFILTHGH
eukprot:753550-Amorphochlora_amoeboformis.AAC.1